MSTYKPVCFGNTISKTYCIRLVNAAHNFSISAFSKAILSFSMAFSIMSACLSVSICSSLLLSSNFTVNVYCRKLLSLKPQKSAFSLSLRLTFSRGRLFLLGRDITNRSSFSPRQGKRSRRRRSRIKSELLRKFTFGLTKGKPIGFRGMRPACLSCGKNERSSKV